MKKLNFSEKKSLKKVLGFAFQKYVILKKGGNNLLDIGGVALFVNEKKFLKMGQKGVGC